MRRAWLLVLTSCTPNIASGAYLCGPEQACPHGLVCNGADNACVLPIEAEPFACDPADEHEPDNDLAHALPVGSLACVSPARVFNGCLAAGDAADWFAFDAPSSCTAVQANLKVTFPVAWEPLAMSLSANDGTVLGTDGDCDDTTPSGEQIRCLKVTLAPGGHYGASIAPAGSGDCNGDCAFNRYTLSVALGMP